MCLDCRMFGMIAGCWYDGGMIAGCWYDGGMIAGC